MSQEFDPVAYAWKVHDALDAWTSKVDAKASIVLAVETGTMGLVVTQAGKNGPLAHLSGMSVLLFRVGVFVLLAAILLAGTSVIPQLRRRAARREWRANSIYFGHLRHWNPSNLAETLREREADSSLDELARQHVRMAAIAWRKHSFLQISMVLVPAAVLLIFLSSL
jgi:hypothetical protein